MNRVIIWGAGHDYQMMYNLLNFEILKGNIEIVAIADSNRWQYKIDSYPAISPQEISQYKYDFIIVPSSKFYTEIVENGKK